VISQKYIIDFLQQEAEGNQRDSTSIVFAICTFFYFLGKMDSSGCHEIDLDNLRFQGFPVPWIHFSSGNNGIVQDSFNNDLPQP
jgi:hypothetical protein